MEALGLSTSVTKKSLRDKEASNVVELNDQLEDSKAEEDVLLEEDTNEVDLLLN